MAQYKSSGQFDSVAGFSRIFSYSIAQWTAGLAEAAINDG
jgi:hypothetical protein